MFKLCPIDFSRVSILIMFFTFVASAEQLNDDEQKSYARQCLSVIETKVDCLHARIKLGERYDVPLYKVPLLKLALSDTYRYEKVLIDSISLDGAVIKAKVHINYQCTSDSNKGWSKPEVFNYTSSGNCIFSSVAKNTYPKPSSFLIQYLKQNNVLDSKVYAKAQLAERPFVSMFLNELNKGEKPFNKETVYREVTNSTEPPMREGDLYLTFLGSSWETSKKYFGEYLKD